MAKLLDKVLGEDSHNTYKKAELKSFLQFHRNPQGGVYGTAGGGDGHHPSLPLSDEEISILNGVLGLNERSVKQIMTPIKVSFSYANKLQPLEALVDIGRRHSEL